jgi:hypothetical protein
MHIFLRLCLRRRLEVSPRCCKLMYALNVYHGPGREKTGWSKDVVGDCCWGPGV